LLLLGGINAHEANLVLGLSGIQDSDSITISYADHAPLKGVGGDRKR